MGKMNLNSAEFEDDKTPETSQPPMLPPDDHPIPIPPEPKGPVFPAALVGGSETTVIIALADQAIKTIGELGRYVAEVSRAKERTRQVQEWAGVQIETARQETRREELNQKEGTRRFMAQCAKELEIKRADLRGLRDRLQDQDAQRRSSHQSCMASLEILEKSVNVLISQAESLCGLLREEEDAERRKDLLAQMDKTNSKLVELAGKIVELRQK